MIKFLTLRQFISPLSLFLKEIPFTSFTNAIDLKIERVLTGFLIGHFLKILRRSEVTINLTRRLKKMEASEFAPL
jgi:hypothetical protein